MLFAAMERIPLEITSNGTTAQGHGYVDATAGRGVEAWSSATAAVTVNCYAQITQTTVIRAFLRKHALEDIEVLDTDIDRIYGEMMTPVTLKDAKR